MRRIYKIFRPSYERHHRRESVHFNTLNRRVMMSSPQHRIIDYVFFTYFLHQIPTTLLLDSQSVYPEWLYPNWVKFIRHQYLETYKDPFMANAWEMPWFLSICLLEHLFSMPFFVWATISYYHGAKVRSRILIPSIIYSSHTMTAIIAMWAMALCADFSNMALGPRTFYERLKLSSVYLPYFFVCLANLIDSVKLISKYKYH